MKATVSQLTSAGLLVAFAMSSAVAGCEALGLGYARIGELLKEPSRYEGQEVRIKGKVIDVMKLPLVQTKLYVVKDDSGEIVVLTGGLTPSMGSEVRVKGVLDTLAILRDKRIGLHLKESQRW